MALQSPFFNNNANKREDVTPRMTSPNAAAAAGNTASATTVTPTKETSFPSGKENDAKLTVGPNIKLKGVEITDCDTLLVEGSVEATMDSRVIQISERGSFKGSAEIDFAEIHGLFEGELTVRQKLVIHSTGKVTGRVRYGKIVIEEGGQLSGEIEFGTAGRTATTTSNDKGLRVANA